MDLNKKNIAIGIILFSLVTIIIIINSKAKEQEKPYSFILGERYDYELNNVDKILIRSGMDGSKYETTDPKKINELVNILNNTKFTLSENQGDACGWTYYIDFFEHRDDESWFRVALGAQPISYFYKEVDREKDDSRNFNIEDREILVKELDEYFNKYVK